MRPEGMLEACRRRLRAEPPDVHRRASLQRGDMRGFKLGRSFRLVTIPFRPFQHLVTVQEQLACLAAVRRHLERNGQLVFDVFNPSIHRLAKPADGVETDEEPPFTLPDGRVVIRRHRFLERDLITQVNSSELVYHLTHLDGRPKAVSRLEHDARDEAAKGLGGLSKIGQPGTAQNQGTEILREPLGEPQLARHVGALKIERLERTRPNAFGVPRMKEFVRRRAE